MLKVRYWFFTKPSGAGDDHRADRVRPHDVGIVVDLDPPDRMIDAKRLAERGEQLLLARRLGEFARQRLARVARGVDELFLLAALRRADRDAVPARAESDLGQSVSALGTSWLSRTRRGAGRSR